ncbi:helix-turn-helix transcriptional regulator [Pseudomonas sp. 148P]|uniref:Helix-turn-helix transcriptional regulator n=1 Tax=Pseudomonas ulcerans TaxID=3115852 RepID=A0ABU7HV67_9PSED|nr:MULTISPECIES: helix-turn-helix transcriptional regulator [unclassified Pseudomonas]MEE1923549.1 helix-turn-helix transcriptional regulator [Pseudomonas sp. 147P]MEE1935384.1 helix-turn-helix transcriptional regulator [Pseudomonas sp. 148P]
MKTIHTAAYQHLLVLLVEARKASGLTQQELSERLGRPQSYVSKFERGERRLDVVEFLVIARSLEIDPHGVIGEVYSVLG